MAGSALTARAVLLGALVGIGLGIANLVFGLKAGLSVGVALTAVTVAGALRRLAPTAFTLAEGTTTQSVASAAGYSTGSTLASSAAAWVLLNGHPPPAIVIATWTLLVSLLGCLLAWPMRGVFLEREKLPFPSGTAAAIALRSLWEKGESAVAQTRALLGSIGVSVALTLSRDLLHWLPATLGPSGAAARWGFGVDCSLLALGAGALLGLRLGLSLLLGSVLTFAIAGPLWASAGLLGSNDFPGAAGFAMWPGTALFAGAALTHFVIQMLRLARRVRVAPSTLATPISRRASLAAVGTTAVGLALIGHYSLGIPSLAIAVSLCLAFPLCLISCRVTGETDVTPGGPMGQLTQLGVGILTPGNPAANVMAGGLTAGAAASAADLMTDLKTGALLQVDPRQQFFAQLIGCLVGSVFVAPLFVVLVPSIAALGSNGFAAPAAQVFASTARLLVEGTSVLPAGAGVASCIAAGVGVALAAIEALIPPRSLEARATRGARDVLPSPVALGLAMLLPPSLSMAFALGAIGAYAWGATRSAAFETLGPPIAGGLIAGESLAGAGIAVHTSLS